MSKDQIILTVLGVLVAALFIWAVIYTKQQNKIQRDTQRIITDLELLRLFEQQPGGLLSAKMVADLTDLSPAEASSRVHALATGGLLRAGMNPTGTKYFYELTARLEEVPGLELSDNPFLTIEDLQRVFVAYDYKVSPHDLMVATGLPWKILSREMKHFRKQGVIETVAIARPDDSHKQYVLLPPYDKPESLDVASRERINQEVKQVLYDERFLV